MNIGDILILSAIAFALFFALRHMRRAKKTCGGCGGCSRCEGCAAKAPR